MFTLSQINDIHERLGKQATLAQYLQALEAIGVVKYDSFLTDGHSEYYGKNNEKIVSPSVHKTLEITHTSNAESMHTQLHLHEQGKIDYLEMSRGLAESGIEKWTFDTIHKTITYYGKDGNKVLVEEIE
ncbi:DUF1398 domain-containing protein [Rhodocytophaga rosea]|uniref:DUF1398 domain-containing protein n=1 Tax=Rhodocytophaga rosea TaxID=2704465 RepID=A0A6C0GQT2_9BACT|nr:DUF1398 family protein [Rhodocytophaga rosea]QHT70419.1 DUF1398 domain-containing protein [Rhodocytophaga rosea]